MAGLEPSPYWAVLAVLLGLGAAGAWMLYDTVLRMERAEQKDRADLAVRRQRASADHDEE